MHLTRALPVAVAVLFCVPDTHLLQRGDSSAHLHASTWLHVLAGGATLNVHVLHCNDAAAAAVDVQYPATA